MPRPTMVTESMAVRVFELKSEHLPLREIARLVGVGMGTVQRTLRGAITPRPDVPDSTWSAECMTPDELASWAAANALTSNHSRAERPCADCPAWYAGEMRPLGLCNGIPAGGS